MLLDLLRLQTKPYHDRLEESLNFMDPELTMEEYKTILRKLWGFYIPVEQQINSITEINQYLNFDQRKKQTVLENDLRALAINIDRLRLCNYVPCIETVPQALGCLYVLEGSTLGGQIISKHIEKRLELDKTKGCAFFHGYGEQTGSKWREFCQVLCSYPESNTIEQKSILDTAIITFLAFEKWFIEE
jgi:heme oxygenase (biliverdin-IX-beta and delta-forming)